MSEYTCSVHGCDRPSRNRGPGLCEYCYQRQRKKAKPPCIVEGCGRQYFSKGYCYTHYLDPGKRYIERRRSDEPLADLVKFILSRAERDGAGCLVVPGQDRGRMRARWCGKTWLYHRLVALHTHGYTKDVPGLETIHLCERGWAGCVTPEHLKLGSHVENIRRYWSHRKGFTLPRSFSG